MPNPNAADATKFETDVVNYLKSQGLFVYKPRQTSALDVGDIHLESDYVLQAKAWANVASALREGTADAQIQAKRANRFFGMSVIKKRGGRIADAYVSMPLHVFAALINSREETVYPTTPAS